MIKYFLGIDLGGTKCDVLIGNENGKVMIRHTGTGWNDDDFIGGQIDCMKARDQGFFGKAGEQKHLRIQRQLWRVAF